MIADEMQLSTATTFDPSPTRLPGGLYAPLLVAASYGPYLIAQRIRPEHFVLYLTLPIALGWVWLGGRSLLRIPALSFQAIWLGTIIVWGFVVTALLSKGRVLSTSAIGQMESFLQPFATILVISVFAQVRDREEAVAVLQRCCIVLITVLGINAALIVVQIVRHTSWFFQAFLPPRDAVRGNVWDRSLSTGRFIGIFANPFDSGLTNSLGLLAWSYLARTRRVNNWMLVALVFLMVGAVASVSKVSLVIGIPLFVLSLLAGRGVLGRVFNRKTFTAGLAFVIVVGIWLSLGHRWSGVMLLNRLVNAQSASDFFQALTAGRYSSGQDGDPGVMIGFLHVWRNSPLFGLGFAAGIVTDSAYLSLYAAGGILDLLLYAAFQVSLGIMAVRYFHRSPEAKLLFFMFLLTTAAALGDPVITANRFAPTFWTMYTLVIASLYYLRQETRSVAA